METYNFSKFANRAMLFGSDKVSGTLVVIHGQGLSASNMTVEKQHHNNSV